MTTFRDRAFNTVIELNLGPNWGLNAIWLMSLKEEKGTSGMQTGGKAMSKNSEGEASRKTRPNNILIFNLTYKKISFCCLSPNLSPSCRSPSAGAAAAPGSYGKRKFLAPTKSGILGAGPSNPSFRKSFRWFWFSLQFENQHPTPTLWRDANIFHMLTTWVLH